MKRLFPLVLLFCSIFSYAQMYYPGGVAGAETWYIVDHTDLAQDVFVNFGEKQIGIEKCETLEPAFFNFNPSVFSEKLCLTYRSPLERSTSRNIFFVGESEPSDDKLVHVSTKSTELDSVIRNRFNITDKSIFVNKQLAEFTGQASAYINFYNWNIYQVNKKFKSYGLDGETTFSIGKNIADPETEGQDFKGNFPEYISYPFELTANQQNRVESYLALKYGITLSINKSYLNAKNTAFWNKASSGLFGKRIFGIGRDNISGLNQLQSQSVHLKDHLIASVETLEENNVIKQQTTSIPNNHFIVFGDNGLTATLGQVNSFYVRPLKKVWLSQNTGEDARNISMNFRFNFIGELKDALDANPGYKIWMLHDRYVTNQQQSNFDNQYVEYYEPGSIADLHYAIFKEIKFDTDDETYDQFTFGIGPEMIVQVQFTDNECNSELANADIVITGGQPPYSIDVLKGSDLYRHFDTNETVVSIQLSDNESYTVNVTDSTPITATTTINVDFPQIVVDLGPDQNLSTNQPQILLDAGQGVNDANATYHWYKDNVLIDYFTATLMVNQPGEYKVVVTGSNRICQVTDSIVVGYGFTGEVAPACGENNFDLTISLEGGMPPYTTIITGPGVNTSQLSTSNQYTVEDLPFAEYTVKVIDANSYIYEEQVLNPMLGVALDVRSQLEDSCIIQNSYNFFQHVPFNCPLLLTLDAAALVTNPNVSYEWFMDGQPLFIYEPVVELVQDNAAFPGVQYFDVSWDYNEFTVKATNESTGCSVSETFALVKSYGVRGVTPQSITKQVSGNGQTANKITSTASINTTVYPNPSASGATFYYEAHAAQPFDGTIEIYTPTGSLVRQVAIGGKTTYIIPFSLLTSGVYFIYTKVGDTLITDKIIIQ